MIRQKVFVAGHNGMVGRAIVRELNGTGKVELILRSRDELDLLDLTNVDRFFQEFRPDHVYIAAAKVGGIHANNEYPADFILENLVIQNNLISAAYRYGVSRLLMLGSSCIYPKLAEQPISEAALMTGPLESTNEPYATAKIAGIKLCESFNRQYGTDFRSVMPTNLYGPNDNFHPENSHVIPAMMQRFHKAKEQSERYVTIWGTGKPMREFLHVSDMAKACVHVMSLGRESFWEDIDVRCSHINVGTGEDCSIRELAETMARVVGFQGDLVFDTEKPDGTPRKLLDVSRLSNLGWKASVELEQGLAETYQWFLTHRETLRGACS